MTRRQVQVAPWLGIGVLVLSITACSPGADSTGREAGDTASVTSTGQALAESADSPLATSRPSATSQSPIASSDEPATSPPTSDASARTDALAPEPTVVPGRASDIPPEQIQEHDALTDLVVPVVEVQAEILGAPTDANLDEVTTVADGPAEGQLLASLAEFENNGWTQEGTPRVVSSVVDSVDLDSEPATVELTACLDHSKVDIIDADGNSIIDTEANKRVLNIFTLHYLDERWVVYNQSFPDDVVC